MTTQNEGENDANPISTEVNASSDFSKEMPPPRKLLGSENLLNKSPASMANPFNFHPDGAKFEND